MTPVKVTSVILFGIFLLLLGSAIHSSATISMAVTVGLLPLFSYMIGRRAMLTLHCERDVTEFVPEDEPFDVQISVQGQNNLIGTTEAHDRLPEWAERDSSANQSVDEQVEKTVITYTLVGTKRGEYQIGPLSLRASDPLGFFKFSRDYPLVSRLVILPKPLNVPGLRIQPAGTMGDHQYEGVGAKGSGIDFDGVREYRPGDELRRVHWRSTARHGKLNVVEYEHTKSEDAVIVIDLAQGSELGSGKYTTLEYAIKIAAALAEQAVTTGSSVRLAGAGITGIATQLGTGYAHLYILLEALALARADYPEPLTSVFTRLIDSLDENETVVCLASRVDPELSRYVQILAAKGVKVQFILLSLTGTQGEAAESAALNLAVAGAHVVVVECSTSDFNGQVTYEYAC